MSACDSLVHHRRPLRDQPRDEAAYSAAPDDLLDPAEQAGLFRQRPLRRPEVRLVQHQVQRLVVGLVEYLGERRHEAPPSGTAAKFRQIDHAGQRLSGNQPAQCRTHAFRQRHVRMSSAEHHDRIAGRFAVRPGAQPPPDAKRVDDRHPRARAEQPFDQALGRVRLA